MSTIVNKFHDLLTRRRIIIVACLLIIVGYMLMSGPESSISESVAFSLRECGVAMQSEQSFNPDIFSTRRIVIAPIFCLAGYLLMIVGILYKKEWTGDCDEVNPKVWTD